MASNASGDLLASGGSDGNVCLWQWGRDEFLHQVGVLYLTNLPIMTIEFNATTYSARATGLIISQQNKSNLNDFHRSIIKHKNVILPSYIMHTCYSNIVSSAALHR